MRRTNYIVIILLLIAQTTFGQVYQNMAQPGYKFGRARFDSVLTIPSGLGNLKNISGGQDTGQIRFNKSDSSVYVWNGRAWIKAGGGTIPTLTQVLESAVGANEAGANQIKDLAAGTSQFDAATFGQLTDTANLRLRLSDTATMLSNYAKTAAVNLKLNISDTASMLAPYSRVTVSSYGKNATRDSTILLLSNGTRYAAKDSIGGGGASVHVLDSVPVWNRKGTVLRNITASDVNAYEPSVLYEGSPQILTGATKVFKMTYTVGWSNATRSINYAESLDGVSWTSYTSNPIISARSRSFVIKDGSTYYTFVSNSTQTNIDVYTSTNLITQTLAASSILPANSWGTGFFNTSVIKDGATWYMLVDGLVGGNNFAQGAYSSSSPTSGWAAVGTNPVMSGLNQGAPFLKKIESTYYAWVLESGASNAVLPTDLWRYSSTNFTTWTKNTTAPIFPRRAKDEGANMAKGQVADPYLVSIDSAVYMYYAKSPDGDDSIAGQQIGLAIANMTFDKLVKTREGDIADINSNDFVDDGRIGIGVKFPRAPLSIGTSPKTSKPTLNFNHFAFNASLDVGTIGWNNFWNGSAIVRQNTSMTATRFASNTGTANANASFLIAMTNIAGTETNALQVAMNSAGTSYITGISGLTYLGTAAGTPTARLHIAAGTATASTAPLKFTAGTKLTTPEAGAIEYVTGNVVLQSDGITLGANAGAASAKLDIQSTTQGVLIPRMTLTQRNAIASPAAGLQVIVTGETGGEFLSFYNSSTAAWQRVVKLTSAGRLLLGTTTESTHILDVVGTQRITGQILSTVSGNSALKIQSNSWFELSANDIISATGSSLIGGSTPGMGIRYGAGVTFGTGARGYHYLTDNYALFSSQTSAVNLSSGVPASAVLEARSTTQGFLPPRMTTAQKTAIGTPAAGLQVYDTTLNQMSYYNGTTWVNF